MQVLVCLARAVGEPVSRDMLAQACWGGVVVSEDAVNRCIQRLRRLGEEAAGESFVIETIPRVGYRLRRRAAAQEHGPPQAGSLAAADAPSASVCVLPFDNMSGDPEQDYFSDGITEDIITDLGSVSALFVVARTTAFAFKGRVADVRELARELNVRHVITGSVRKAEGRVRISAQLIDGATGGQVWAERYDRDLKDIFVVQDEISQAIVSALKGELLPEEKASITRRGTDSAEAYDLFLMAREKYVSGDQGVPGWGEAIIRLCRRATEIDPNYANAWTFLALGYAAAGWRQSGRGADRGLAAAERALALNPDLAEAHAVTARIFSDSGRHDEASREIEIALRRDPKSWLDPWQVNYTAALVYMAQKRYADAIPYYEAAAVLNPTDIISPAYLIAWYVRTDDHQAIVCAAEVLLAHVEAALAKNGDNAHALALGAHALGFLGRLDRAGEWMERALLMDPDNPHVRFLVAQHLLANFKDTDGALGMLAPVLAKGPAGYLDIIEFSPHFDPVRDHPRFKAMMAGAEARLAAEQQGKGQAGSG